MKIYQLISLAFLKMRTQNKENYYYMFWIVAMVAFIVPQIFTALAYHKLVNILTQQTVEVEIKKMPPYQVEYIK